MRLLCTILKIFLTLAVVCLLSACGFHLRGQSPLPPQFHVLYLQTNDPYGALTKQLRQTFNSRGVLFAENCRDAPLTLSIISEIQGRQATSFSPSTQIQTYNLIETVTFQILDPKGVAIIPPRSVTTTRGFTSNPNQANSNLYEENTLLRDMRRDVSYQILNQFNAASVREYFCKCIVR